MAIRTGLSRRAFIECWLALPVSAAIAASLSDVAARASERVATPSCGPDSGPTIRQTEGPYFSGGTPLKTDFRADDPNGTPFTLTGFVLTTACAPVADARIELWHADSKGRYDNDGFRLRGHAFSGADGRFVFDTVVPGLYPGRTRHFHVKVRPAGGRELTTQLYFPDEARNGGDRIFDPSLLMEVVAAGDGSVGRFDFVVRAA